MFDPVARPTLGVLNQGTLFTCANAEDYGDCNVTGIIITARCDVAQSKAPVFNYLPVVSLDDWIHRDGRMILCERLAKSNVGRMKGCLKSAKQSETLLSTQSPKDILRVTFGVSEDEVPSKGVVAQFSQLIQDQEAITSCMNSAVGECAVVPLANRFSKDRDALLRELFEQRLNGYYFLRSVAPENPKIGYVVLLRQVRHISRDLASCVGRGLTADEFTLGYGDKPEFVGSLSFRHEEFAMPIGALRSPHIEHLMQVFSSLFSRIGLPDLEEAYTNNLWTIQPSVPRNMR